MFGKASIWAMAAAIALLAIPASAAAQWTNNDATLESNVSAGLTGQAKFEGQVGNVECQVAVTAQLTAGTTTADAQFDVDNKGAVNDEEMCSVGGGLITVGCTDVEQVTVSGEFFAHATSTTTIAVTTGTIQNHLTGGALCPKTLQLTPGTVHVTTSTTNTWTTGQLSGALQLHIPIGGTQQVTISGHGSLIPLVTAGIA